MMITRPALSLLLGLAVATAGCAEQGARSAGATTPASEPAPTVPESPPPSTDDGAKATCDASSLGDLVGKAATSELAADALKRSGAKSMRLLKPGMAVTMDYREDRLNIEVDAADKVVGSRCG